MIEKDMKEGKAVGNCLVLLTKTYPYAKGEEFIEDEIPRLAESFEKIIILATSVPDGAVQTRHTPQNVSCHAIFANAVKRSLPVTCSLCFRLPIAAVLRTMRNGRQCAAI